jgi:hypothetical protein
MQDDERTLPSGWRRTTARFCVRSRDRNESADCAVQDGIPMTIHRTPQLPVLAFLPLFAHVRFWMIVYGERMRILPAGDDLLASIAHASEHAGFVPYVIDTADGCVECARLRSLAEAAQHGAH